VLLQSLQKLIYSWNTVCLCSMFWLTLLLLLLLGSWCWSIKH
jgi:hypothetical protein